MSNRTFTLKTPHMKGSDVQQWQEWLNGHLRFWDVDYAITEDGDYGETTRSTTASVAHGMGLIAAEAMAAGVTPELRTKLRNATLTPEELTRAKARKTEWLPGFRRRFEHSHLSLPTPVITQHSWGWNPPGHDGVDLIAPWNNPMLAICDGEIVRADAEGWWGKGAHPSAGHPVGDGDGIIIIECGVNVGPFKKGMHFCYGHGEHAAVRVGQEVRAGAYIGKVGWANASHIHFMANATPPQGNFYTGRGDRDPWPFVNYAGSHS